MVVAGSPCQDLTLAGGGNGVLGLAGDRSSLFYYVHTLLWLLVDAVGRESVRFIVENAGSMKDIQFVAISRALGLIEHKDSVGTAKETF